MPRKLILTSVALTFAIAMTAARSAGAPAGGAELSGKVVDGATGDPLVAASVSVKGTPLRSSTDGAGSFVIDEVPIGSVVLSVSRIGYKSREITVTVTPDAPTQWTIALAKGKH